VRAGDPPQPPVPWVFLRHGQSTANAAGVLAGWNDVPLTAEGEAQAAAAGLLLEPAAIARVLVSDLARARHTAALALDAWVARTGRPRPPEVVLPALRERNLGAWQGLSLQELRADGRVERLLDWHARPPGGESLADLMGRVLPALAAHQGPEPTLVVAHGGVLRGVLGLLDGLDLAEAARLRVANAVPLPRTLPPGSLERLSRQAG
jgi:broad specificity phosphatase PhoE